MLSSVMTIALIVLLLLTFWQDMRSRILSVWLWAVMTGIVIIIRFADAGNGVLAVGYEMGINVLIIFWQLFFLTLYVSVKNRKLTQPVGQFLGLGDVFFWIVPTLFFTPVSFLIYWVFSLLFALAGHLIFRSLLSATYPSTVPLAGMQALCMAGYVGVSKLDPTPLFACLQIGGQHA
ncbi:hypothetical protein [Xanthocytophaga agilis]|uniref:Prepilin type IV endopeptidase peptidase domain-containing protein n=1 Tax=Xanthocytophaga agilis TaxID=3048010 RepID=A0AAE3R5V3_9BACT|nr:hypothetical protein [Xanthocytophaga agilis]MDJ1501247.1 hypothetical protein [Xanthocytophaga agilis]